MILITLPIPTVSEANRREHWARRAKRARSQRKAAWALTPAHPLPVVVKLVRVGAKMLDDDNLRGALKAVRDGIADRLGVADNDERVVWEYGQKKGAPGVEVLMEAA